MRAPETSEILLQVEGVSLSFGGVKALRDVSFNIRKGEIRAIIGPNGAGKTSMLNVINGFYHPNHGTITFKGQTRREMKPFEAARGGIARTFQNIRLFGNMTVMENILVGLHSRLQVELIGTILRLPMIYGPGDPLHRFYPVVKRVDDGRTAMMLDESTAQWGGIRG